MRQLPILSALPAFEATARLGSMKAAGDDLGRTHGAISKQIAALSEDLGVPLFRKDGVGVELTPQGREFAVSVADALDGLAAARAKIVEARADGVIEVGVSATFALRWLMQRMPGLYQEVPGIELSFRMTGLHKAPDHELDVVLTFDRLSWVDGYFTRSDIVKLGDVAFGPVHAPEFSLKREGQVYRCANRFVQEVAPHTWDSWSALSGIHVLAEHDQSFPHSFLALEAAAAGMGIAMAERRLVEVELAQGRLVAPFGFHTIEQGLGAIVTQRGRGRAKVDALLDWLGRQT